MSIELQVVNGPMFQWGDKVVVKYVGELSVTATLTGSIDLLGSIYEFTIPITFHPEYHQPAGLTGYTFTINEDNPSEWIGNVNG